MPSKQIAVNRKGEKKMKKIISLALCLLMVLTGVLALASCGTEQEKLKIVDVNLTDEKYAFVVKKGNTQLQSDFNAFLAKIKENGEFDKYVAKYFKNEGEKVGYPIATGSVANNETNLIVATNCPFEPFEYLGEDGKAYGLDIEIAAAYAKEKNLELVIKNIEFDAIFTQVDTGYADIGMAGITVSESRLALNDFTTEYYNASQKLIVPASCTDFDNCKTVEEVEAVLKGLVDKKIGFQTGTTGGLYINGDADWGFAGFKNISGKGYSTAVAAANDMLNGNLYAVVVDAAPAAAIVTALNKSK